MVRRDIAGAIVAVAVVAAGCEDNPVGRQCFIGTEDGGVAMSTVVSMPSLECESRTCLRYQGHEPALCTGECEVDEDCDKVGDSCAGSFVCGVATVVGPFACRKLCICGDFIGDLDGGLPVPAQCR